MRLPPCLSLHLLVSILQMAAIALAAPLMISILVLSRVRGSPRTFTGCHRKD
jgi:hypothetical protein